MVNLLFLVSEDLICFKTIRFNLFKTLRFNLLHPKILGFKMGKTYVQLYRTLGVIP